MGAVGRRRLYRILLLAAGAAVYSASLSGVFIFDDILAIELNPHVRTLSPLWYAAWAEYESPVSGRPLPALSLAVNYALGGLDPFGYKVVNLALHLGCGLALFGAVGGALRMPALRARFGARADELAFAVAGLWLVHPLASEPVNYVTQRTESWMALAYLSMIGCTAKAVISPAEGRWRGVAVFACLMGMVSKEVMVSAPLLLLLFERAYRGETASSVLRRHRSFYGALALTWVPLLVLVAWTFRGDTVGYDEGVSVLDYLWNQGWVLPRYLRLVFWPTGLSHDWGVPRDVSFLEVWPGVLSVMLSFGVAVVLALKRPTVGWPLLFVFAALAPTSSVLPIVTEVAAERRMYLPLAALLALFVVGGVAVLERRGWGGWPAGVAWLALVVALGLTTAAHNVLYGNPLLLWQRVVLEFPDNARAHTNVGQVLIAQGRVEESVAPMRAAIEADPEYALGHNELGVSLGLLGMHSEARQAFERARTLDPAEAKAHVNLAILAIGNGKRDVALRLLRRALKLAPGSRMAAIQLAWLLATSEQGGERRARRAISLAEHGVGEGELSARNLDILAAAYASAGDFDRAVSAALRAHGLALRDDQIALRAAIGRRLERYREGQRWIEP